MMGVMLRALLFVSLLVSFVTALYEDQAGKLDWHKENIGRVTLADFNHQKGARQNQVFVATESNVIAALSMKNGATVWRQVLTDKEPISQLIHAGHALLSVSTANRMLRAWALDTGALLWDTRFAASESAQALVVGDISTTTGSADVALLTNDRVEMRDINTGQLQWTWTGESVVALAGGQKEGLFVVSLASGSLSVQQLDESTGKAKGEASPIGSGGKDAVIESLGNKLVVLDAKACALSVHTLGSPKRESHQLGQGALKGVACTATMTTNEGSLAFNGKDGKGAVVEVSEDLSLKLKQSFSTGERFAGTVDREGNHHLVSINVAEKETALTIQSSNGNGKVRALPACKDLSLQDNGVAEGVFLNVFIKNDGSPGTRLLVVTADHSLSMIRNGEVAWRREEALASIKQAEFIDLPMSQTNQGTELGFVASLSLKLQGKTGGSQNGVAVSDYSVKKQEGKLYTDKFQIRKLAVVMTKANKVAIRD